MIETKFRTTAQQLGTAFNQRVAGISTDGRLTDQHRKARLAREYLTAKQRLTALRREHEADVAAQRLALERSAFGHADMSELRAALDVAASRITNPDQAAAALRRAQRIGDAVTAHAVFVVAWEKGYAGIVEQYTSVHPGAAGALALLRDHDRAAADASDRLFSPFVPFKPADLRAVNDAHLEQMAAEAGDAPLSPPAPPDNFPGMFP